MNLTGDERDELRSTARSLLARESSPERVRRSVAGDPGFDRALWDRMVELGWTTIAVAERDGGAGYGYADLAVVLHELGRAITPSPFLASAVLTATALRLADDGSRAGDLLGAMAVGTTVGSVALANAAGSYDGTRSTITWTRSSGGLQLDGVAGFVLDADLADVLVVSARDEAGVSAFVAVDATAAGVRVAPTPAVDQTRRPFTVELDAVAVPEDRLLRAPGTRTDELLAQVLAVGVIAAACDATGAAEVALERATAYAKERKQFGKAIGSFQAIKHQCADMAIAVEASRAACSAATEALDGDPSEWTKVAAMTSSFVGPACARACELSLLVHGGIGFTWEHDAHLYLKRAKLDEVLFGTPSWHRRKLADAVFPALAPS